jgi:class 3 adenylate cyclase
MRRWGPLDAALLIFVVPIWIAGFALMVKEIATGRLAWVGLVASTPERPDAYPRVAGFQPGWGAEISGLRVGDELLQLGGTDLRGTSALSFVALTRANADDELLVEIEYRRAGERRRASLQLRPIPAPWGYALVSSSFVISGCVVLYRAPRSRSARRYFRGSLPSGGMFLFFHGGSLYQTYAWMICSTMAFFFVAPLGMLWLLSLPEATAPRARWTRVAPWLLAGLGVTFPSWLFGFPLPPEIGRQAHFGLGATAMILALVAIASNYRRADPIGRRQIKWVALGLYFAITPFVLSGFLNLYDPTLWGNVTEVAISAIAVVPICIFIAIFRYSLFDIDRLITTTGSYSLVSGAVLAGLLMVVPQLAEAASGVMGTSQTFAAVALAIALSLTLVPGQRALRPYLERIAFTELYAMETGMRALLNRLVDCRDARALADCVGGGLDELLGPDSSVIYGRRADLFVPIFVRGRLIPPAFESRSALIRALEQRLSPIAVESWSHPRQQIQLSAFDRAALETLAAAVVVPAIRSDELLAFLCLGPKRSGDVYTSTELTWLEVIAEKVSSEMMRMDYEELLGQAQEMHQSLRRYVPEAVVEHVASGEGLEPEKREASVLFVDIRGYATYAERRRVEETFSTIDLYTRTVSSIIRRRSGTVVEFNGDGMMAVFGAPDPLKGKEILAIEAAREIVPAVEKLRLRENHSRGSTLDVGIGIATGEVMAGNIQSVDRLIWSAVGATTNLAARLQTLTRDLSTSIIIDATTRQRAGHWASDFVLCKDTPIRGLSETHDLYALDCRFPERARSSDLRVEAGPAT